MSVRCSPCPQTQLRVPPYTPEWRRCFAATSRWMSTSEFRHRDRTSFPENRSPDRGKPRDGPASRGVSSPNSGTSFRLVKAHGQHSFSAARTATGKTGRWRSTLTRGPGATIEQGRAAGSARSSSNCSVRSEARASGWLTRTPRLRLTAVRPRGSSTTCRRGRTLHCIGDYPRRRSRAGSSSGGPARTTPHKRTGLRRAPISRWKATSGSVSSWPNQRPAALFSAF